MNGWLRSRRPRTAGVVAAAYWLTLFLATHAPGLPRGAAQLSDKTAHFLGYAGLSFLVGWAVRLGRRPLGAGDATQWLVLAAYGAADELSQIPIPGRSAELLDFAADLAGIAAGWAAYRLASRLLAWRRASPPPSRPEPVEPQPAETAAPPARSTSN